jgi:hypothetical protein
MTDRAAIFGVERDELLAGLERIRLRLCCYMGPSCDCKYGATGKGEQTGCPEIREAMVLVAEEFDKLTLTKELFEENATTAMSRIAGVVDRWRDGGGR